MLDTTLDKTIALAGIFQAAKLVRDLAKTGKVDENYLRVSIDSLFKINAKDAVDVYGGTENLALGLNELINIMSPVHENKTKCQDVAKYAFSIIHLERKLIKNKKMLDKIANGISRAAKQAEIFSILHDNVLANIAGIYLDTISTFSFRINVTGDPFILNNSKNSNKIRAILLAGIRSAVLWRQLGGSRFNLVFSRKKILSSAKYLLNQS